MITTILFNTVLFVASGLLFILPTGPQLPEEIASSLIYIATKTAGLNHIFPISEMWAVVSFVVLLEITLMAAYLVFWLIQFVRGN